MRSRRDQVQAHTYVVGRLTSALVHAEPDAPESPLRRTGLGSFGGLLVGTLILAAFMVWGLISPASPASALTAGELLLVKETGTRFIYVGNELHPVLNWASALMLTGGNATITTVSASSLAGIPQGQPLGVLGAPDELPAASALNVGAWLACTQSGRVSVSIGSPPPLSELSANNAVLASGSGAEYLLWRGTRLRLDASWIVNALGLNNAPVIEVAPAWLNAVPAGPDLQPLSVPGAGQPGPVLGGLRTRVGQILVEHNVGSASQLYVVGHGGVAPITTTQAAILLTNRAESAAYQGGKTTPIVVSPATIANAAVLPSGLADGTGVPSAPPHDFLPGGAAVPCMDYPASGGTANPNLVFAALPAWPAARRRHARRDRERAGRGADQRGTGRRRADPAAGRAGRGRQLPVPGDRHGREVPAAGRRGRRAWLPGQRSGRTSRSLARAAPDRPGARLAGAKGVIGYRKTDDR